MKDKLLITPTPGTPAVDFTASTGKMILEGRSIPENPEAFYSQLIGWLAGYYVDPAEITEFELKFEYLNSGSTKFVMEMLRQVRENTLKGHKSVLKWYYEEEDESIHELGAHFMESLDLPMEIIEF